MMVCLHMSEMDGKKYCLSGICKKEICDDKKICEFYVDLDVVKKKGVWDKFRFEREEEGESDEVGWGLPPKVVPTSFKSHVLSLMTAEHPISSSHHKCSVD